MSEIIQPDSSWNDPPTSDDLWRIRWYSKVLNFDLTEADLPKTKLEARDMIYQLRANLKEKNASRRFPEQWKEKQKRRQQP